jgi:hypothetical protein
MRCSVLISPRAPWDFANRRVPTQPEVDMANGARTRSAYRDGNVILVPLRAGLSHTLNARHVVKKSPPDSPFASAPARISRCPNALSRRQVCRQLPPRPQTLTGPPSVETVVAAFPANAVTTDMNEVSDIPTKAVQWNCPVSPGKRPETVVRPPENPQCRDDRWDRQG